MKKGAKKNQAKIKPGISKISKKYKAIIFDLDGTLINSLPYHELAFKDLLLERGIRIDQKNLRNLLGLSTRHILQQLKKKYKFAENIDDLREERRYHYFKFLGFRNIVFPGVIKTLEKLRLNYKLAIATGSSYVTYTHSTDKDFQSLFDQVITINDVPKGKGKPHPDQLLIVSKKLRVKPQDCLMIGDSSYDALSAKRAKMDFIGVTTGHITKDKLLQFGAKTTIKAIKDLNYVL